MIKAITHPVFPSGIIMNNAANTEKPSRNWNCLQCSSLYKSKEQQLVELHRKVSQGVAPSTHPIILLSSAATGLHFCDFLCHLANRLRSAFSCSLRTFVAPLPAPLPPWELRLSMHDFWLSQSFLTADAQQYCCLSSLYSYQLSATSIISMMKLYGEILGWTNVPDLHFMMSLNSSLAPPSAVSPSDAIVADSMFSWSELQVLGLLLGLQLRTQHIFPLMFLLTVLLE